MQWNSWKASNPAERKKKLRVAIHWRCFNERVNSTVNTIQINQYCRGEQHVPCTAWYTGNALKEKVIGSLSESLNWLTRESVRAWSQLNFNDYENGLILEQHKVALFWYPKFNVCIFHLLPACKILWLNKCRVCCNLLDPQFADDNS